MVKKTSRWLISNNIYNNNKDIQWQILKLFSRLKRLFSTDVVIRNVGGNQLKVMDTNHIQQSSR